MLRKFRQATQELLSKRNKVVERLCKVDDEFAIREKAYKDQVLLPILCDQSDGSPGVLPDLAAQEGKVARGEAPGRQGRSDGRHSDARGGQR